MDLSLRDLTVPVLTDLRPEKASTPRILAMSWTRPLVSRGVVEDERIRESLAWRQGWEETWTFGGRDMMKCRGGYEENRGGGRRRRKQSKDKAGLLSSSPHIQNDQALILSDST
jgi:hypothetical protein